MRISYEARDLFQEYQDSHSKYFYCKLFHRVERYISKSLFFEATYERNGINFQDIFNWIKDTQIIFKDKIEISNSWK